MSVISSPRPPVKVYHRAIHRNEMSHWLHRRGKSMPVEDLSEEQRTDIEECFELFDADGSGALDVDEVMEACSVLGLDSGGGGGGGGGMLSQLLGEMESEGIDELDYPRFESVVCRTLGDIALARSRAQQVTDEDENVLDGTRERAMVFKRKQLLGGLLRGGQDLADLASSQDDLLDEINKRFHRVVEMDGVRTKEEQIKELLLELDPVASAVAPVLTQRFKHLETMAGPKPDMMSSGAHHGILEPVKAATPGRRKMSAYSSKAGVRAGQAHAVSSALTVSFGGDCLEIGTPRSPRQDQHLRPKQEAESVVTGPDADGDAALTVTSDSANKTTPSFISHETAALSGATPGSCILRSLPVSEFYECGSSRRTTEKPANYSKDSSPHPRLLPAEAPEPKATLQEKSGTLRLRSSSKMQLHSAIPNKATELKKVLPTCNASIPTHAILTGRVLVSADTNMGKMQTPGRTKPAQPIRRVPLLELHKLARTPSAALPFREASQRCTSRLLLSSDSNTRAQRYEHRGYHTARPPPSSGFDGIDHRHASHRSYRKSNCDIFPLRPSMTRSATSERRQEKRRFHTARRGDNGNLPPI